LPPMSSAISLAAAPAAVEPVSLPRPARHVWQRRYAQVLRVADGTVVMAAVVLALTLRFGVPPTGAVYLMYAVVAATVVLIWLACLSVFRSREPKILGGGSEEYRRVFTATLSAFGAIAIVSMVAKLELTRGYLAIALPLGLAGLLAGRRIARGIVGSKRRRGQYLRSVLIVGEPVSARALMHSFRRTVEEGYAVVGLCCPRRAGHRGLRAVDDVPVWADDDLALAIAESGADTVALTGGDRLGPQGIDELSWQLEKQDVDLVVSPGMVGLAGPRLSMRPVADLPLIHLDKPQYEGAKRFQKRLFDVCFSTVVLLAAAPVFLVAALAVKLTSVGPVFYRSERVGIDGKPFKMIKFRTMVADAEARRAELETLNEADGVLFKIRRDPRITPVGRFLRRFSIDELPQLINVLRREMSVVGPRPPLPGEVETYDQRIRRRLLVRPGITGLWQVSGRSDLGWDEAVRLDLSYVENWSTMGDLAIVVKTLRAVSSGKGAY
jgi:exopolysaccharide biosynthesis polyprenyl glycosylphosphotransferase